MGASPEKVTQLKHGVPTVVVRRWWNNPFLWWLDYANNIRYWYFMICHSQIWSVLTHWWDWPLGPWILQWNHLWDLMERGMTPWGWVHIVLWHHFLRCTDFRIVFQSDEMKLWTCVWNQHGEMPPKQMRVSLWLGILGMRVWCRYTGTVHLCIFMCDLSSQVAFIFALVLRWSSCWNDIVVIANVILIIIIIHHHGHPHSMFFVLFKVYLQARKSGQDRTQASSEKHLLEQGPERVQNLGTRKSHGDNIYRDGSKPIITL